VAAGVPVTRMLRPRLDHLLFADRDALERGIDGLLEELAHPARAPELVALAAERLDALLRPESLVLYAREGEAFEPVFARGALAPPALPAASPLLATLAARSTPLATARALEHSAPALSGLDRAAVEALGAVLVVPVRRAEALAAFVCLGAKRSGDVYTATDTAFLAAVASRLGERLTHLGESERLREARGLQEALRRYVPGAVAERVARGEVPAAGEREVSVLFVDLRGYTTLAEGLRAPEIFATVNRYTERASSVIGAHGGSVVEFHGDGLLAAFGAPDPLAGKERAAVAAARELVHAVEALAGDGAGPPLSVGVGIATGSVFVGNVRGHDREIWSVLGNTTNLAARLQALTRELDASIAIDAPTREAAGYVCADFVARPGLAVRGRSEPVDVWVLPAG
jgi:adenylate cyclase